MEGREHVTWRWRHLVGCASVAALLAVLVAFGQTSTVGDRRLEVAVAAMTLAGMVGPTHRRIGDVGERWRRLLIGAPPAAT